MCMGQYAGISYGYKWHIYVCFVIFKVKANSGDHHFT